MIMKYSIILLLLLYSVCLLSDKKKKEEVEDKEAVFYYDKINGYVRIVNRDFYFKQEENRVIFQERLDKITQRVSRNAQDIVVALGLSANAPVEAILTVLEMAFIEAIKILNPIDIRLSIKLIPQTKLNGADILLIHEYIVQNNASVLLGSDNEYTMYYVSIINQFRYRLPILSPFSQSVSFNNKQTFNLLTRTGFIYDGYQKSLRMFIEKILKTDLDKRLNVLIYSHSLDYKVAAQAVRDYFYNLSNLRYEFEYSNLDNLVSKLDDFRLLIVTSAPKYFRQIMLLSHRKGYTKNNDYVFIYLNTFRGFDNALLKIWYDENSSDDENEEAKEAFRKVLIFSPFVPTTEEYEKFCEMTKKKSLEYYKTTYDILPVSAEHFYDSLMMYAKSLKLAKGSNVTFKASAELNKFLWNSTHNGLHSKFEIDDKGDRKPDVSIYDLDLKTSTFKVAAVYNDVNGLIHTTKAIDWNTPDNELPKIRPKCGYNDDKCTRRDTMKIGIITGLIMFGLVTITGILIFFIFRRAKLAAELKAMAWLISSTELDRIYSLSVENLPSINEVVHHKQSILFNRNTSNYSTQGRIRKKVSQSESDSFSGPNSCPNMCKSEVLENVYEENNKGIDEKEIKHRSIIKKMFNPSLSDSLKRITPSAFTNRKMFNSISVDEENMSRYSVDQRSVSTNPGYQSVGNKRKISYDITILKTPTFEEENLTTGSLNKDSQVFKTPDTPEVPNILKVPKQKQRKASTFMPSIFRSTNQETSLNEFTSAENKFLLSDSTNSINSSMSNKGTKRFTNTAIYKGNEVALKKLSDKNRISITRELQVEVKKIKEMNCDHLCRFIGACLDPGFQFLVTEYCARGSLHDVLNNESIKLDLMFKMSMMQDICRGMLYLQSLNMPHQNLTSKNCLVDSRFVVKISDFGIPTIMQLRVKNVSQNDYMYEQALFRAPEILKEYNVQSFYRVGTFSGDVYSFGIICQEILYRRGAFYCEERDMYSKKELIDLIIKNDIRPAMESNNDERTEEIVIMIKSAWSLIPDHRPTFVAIKQNLKKMNKAGDSGNLLDNILQRMEQHAGNLENQVQKRTQQYLEEKEKAERLLYAMLPESVASQLIANKPVAAESFDKVTIYFSDIVGFTGISAQSTPMEVVEMLNQLYTMLDNLSSEYDVYKVETIGDAYMVVSGLPNRNGDAHVEEICNMALDFLDNILVFRIPHMPDKSMRLRIGVHSGPVCAGVVGRKMPRYCLFGDTVNTTSRMESNGLPLKIHISEESVELLVKTNRYFITERGIIPMKGKGEKRTFWLHGRIDPETNLASIIDNIPYDKPTLGGMDQYIKRSEGPLISPGDNAQQ